MPLLLDVSLLEGEPVELLLPVWLVLEETGTEQLAKANKTPKPRNEDVPKNFFLMGLSYSFIL